MNFAVNLVEILDYSKRKLAAASRGWRHAALLLALAVNIVNAGPDHPIPSESLSFVIGEPAPLLEQIESPPLGLPVMDIPKQNPVSEKKIALGRKLFFDRRLSFNGTLS